MKFHADKVIVRGPGADGGFDVVLKVGEYEKSNLKPILDLPPDVILSVTLEEEQ